MIGSYDVKAGVTRCSAMPCHAVLQDEYILASVEDRIGCPISVHGVMNNSIEYSLRKAAVFAITKTDNYSVKLTGVLHPRTCFSGDSCQNISVLLYLVI